MTPVPGSRHDKNKENSSLLGCVTSLARKRKSLIWMNTGCHGSQFRKEEVKKRHKTLRSSIMLGKRNDHTF